MRVYLIIRAKVVTLRRLLWAPAFNQRILLTFNYKYHEKIISTYPGSSAFTLY